MLSVRESQGYGSHVSGAYRENNGFCTDPALNCDGENSMRFTRLETERCCTDSVRICDGTLGFFSLKRPHIWKLVVLGCGAICHWDSQQFSCGERIKYAPALSQYKQTKLFILDLMHCFIVMCDSLPFLVTVTSFGSSSAFTVTKYN